VKSINIVPKKELHDVKRVSEDETDEMNKFSVNDVIISVI